MKQLILNFSRGLDTSIPLTSSNVDIEVISSSANGDWTSSQQVTYAVDGDSTDYTNSGQAVVLLLEDSLLHSDSIRISYSATTLADSASPSVNQLLDFSQVDATNLSSVFRIEDLTSTKSSISEDLGYDGTPTTAQIVSLALEGNDSTNYLILDQEILSNYYDVDGAADGSNLALYNVVADHGYFTRNDANTGWFYQPEVNFSGQVIVFALTYLMALLLHLEVPL